MSNHVTLLSFGSFLSREKQNPVFAINPSVEKIAISLCFLLVLFFRERKEHASPSRLLSYI